MSSPTSSSLPRRASLNQASVAHRLDTTRDEALAAGLSSSSSLVDSLLALELSLDLPKLLGLVLASSGLGALAWTIWRHRRKAVLSSSHPFKPSPSSDHRPVSTPEAQHQQHRRATTSSSMHSAAIDEADEPTPSWMSSRANVTFDELDEPSWVSRIDRRTPSPMRRSTPAAILSGFVKSPPPQPEDDDEVAVGFNVLHSYAPGSSRGCYFAARFHPNDEIKQSLVQFVQQNHLKAAAIISCVGSVVNCQLRLADAKADVDPAPSRTVKVGEIVSLFVLCIFIFKH